MGPSHLAVHAPADLGALVEAALKEAKDALFGAGRPEVTWGDAMVEVEVAQRSMGAVTSTQRRDAYRTYVHLAPPQAGGTPSEGGWLTGQPRLPQQITKKLTCDGILQPLWHTQGAPVNVGRAQRIVAARTRRLVEDRDRGCRFPGCAASTHVECHHVIHWVNGGPTDTWNLASLCPYHHDGHHAGDFTIAGNADKPHGLTFTHPHGHPIKPGPTFTTPPQPAPASPLSSDSPSSPSSPDSPGSPSSPSSPDSPDSPSSPDSPPPSSPPPEIRYRGPTGESLDLGWVTFTEPREPAYP